LTTKEVRGERKSEGGKGVICGENREYDEYLGATSAMNGEG
jgi:hypothetical protein